MPRQEINYKLVTKLEREMRDAESRPVREYEIWDTKLEGFLLRVKPSGTVSYAMQYTRGKRITIGTLSEVEHAEARKKALAIRLQHEDAKDGKAEDPVEERRRREKERKQPKPLSQTDTYLEFLNSTYRSWLRLNLKHGDYAYTTLVKAFPEFHNLALNQITPGAIETWRTKRLEKGLNANTINRQLSDLKACLHRARDIWDLNIADKLERVKPCKIDRSPKVRYLSNDEETRLRAALDARESELRSGQLVYKTPTDLTGCTFADHLKPAVLLSINTGLRQGELLQLTWDAIDWDRRILTVIGTTSKTGKTRHIPLNDEALFVLREWKKQPGVKSPFVFTGKIDSTGTHAMTEIGKSWERLLVRAKISKFRWHDLRHTFASKLVMAGVDLNTVRELLGHSDYKMTLRYAHLAPEHKAAAVARLVIASAN